MRPRRRRHLIDPLRTLDRPRADRSALAPGAAPVDLLVRLVAVALLALALASGCTTKERLESPPLERSCVTHFVLRPESPAQSVRIIGSWSADPKGDALVWEPSTGAYRISIRLPPGRYSYHFDVDGEPRLDPQNGLTRYDSGRERNDLLVADCQKPELRVESVETSGDRVFLTLAFWRTEAGPGVDAATLTSRLDGIDVTPRVELLDNGDRLRLTFDGVGWGKHWFELSAADRDGRVSDIERAPVWVETRRFQWDDALIYQVMIDRFRREGGVAPLTEAPTMRQGGDLAGLVEKLEAGYFDALGVNVIWISPLNDNPELQLADRNGRLSEAYHGYWPLAPRTVEPKFGGEEWVERLIAEAHDRGIRVIVDYVMNHAFTGHPYVKEHRDWFYGDGSCVCGTPACPWSVAIQDCWFTEFLPDLNFRRGEALDAQLDDALFWARRFDLDGLRLDAVPMMPRFVVRQLAARVHRELEAPGTRFYLLGEVFTAPGDYQSIRYFLGPDSLDGAFQFPLMWALRGALANRQLTMRALHQAVLDAEDAYRYSTAVMAPFVGNHDVPRFISEANGDRLDDPFGAPAPPVAEPRPYRSLMLAHTVVLTLPGAPVLYYGDEIGMPGSGDPDNRRMMRFDDRISGLERSVLEHVQRLGRTRRCSEALRRGRYQVLSVQNDLWVFARIVESGAAIVIVHRGSQPTTTNVTLPSGLPLPVDGRYVDALSGAIVRVEEGRIALTVGADTSQLLLAADDPCLTPE
ncbi:MAG: hypothetical protein KC609_02920 [Myxococcales bacterium]|nr:hypothetical protein [Myxococcales bacterium]